LIKHLLCLLARLHEACLALDDEARLRAYTLSADAHHVAAGGPPAPGPKGADEMNRNSR